MTIIVQTTASASARDYNWLQAAIAGWNGNRTDLVAKIPDFIMLAEQRIRADLEARNQSQVVTLTAEAGGSTVDVPADFAELRSLKVVGEPPLKYLTPGQLDAQYVDTAACTPRHYTIIGDQFYLGPATASAISLTCTYRAKLPALADSGGSNWLITSHANVYLAASMCVVLTYTKNLAELPVWEKNYADAIASVNKPDWSSASQLVVRSDVRSI